MGACVHTGKQRKERRGPDRTFKGTIPVTHYPPVRLCLLKSLEPSEIAPPSRDRGFSTSVHVHGMEGISLCACEGSEGGLFQYVHVTEGISYSSCKNVIS